MLRPSALAVETRVTEGPCGESQDEQIENAEFVRRLDVFYYNQSRQGKIKKHVNEKYLRRRAFCGLKTCTKCEDSDYETHRLNPTVESSTFNRVMNLPHCLIVDSKVLIKFIDLFQENVFKNVVIPLSAWKNVKAKSRKIFFETTRNLRVKSDELLRFWQRWIRRNYSVGSTRQTRRASDFNSNLIVENILIATTADYLIKHWLEKRVVPIVLTTNDADMKTIGENYKYVTTVLNYVKGLPKSEERRLLVNRVRELTKMEEHSKTTQYEYYLNEHELDNGIRAGKVKVGKFTVTYENYQEAYVAVGDAERVLVYGRAAMNRAISGDTVAVEILPESKWRAPEGRFRTKEAEQLKDDDEIEKVDSNKPTSSQSAKVKTGKVVSIVDRPLKHYCGILEPPNLKGGSICLFRPADKRIPPIRINNRGYHSAQADGTSVGKKVVCSIVRWPANSSIPEGSLIRVIGKVGEKETENEVILLEHDVRFRPFTDAERSELPKENWKPANPLEPYRRDLTHLDVCSVDPVGCTDIDDALHYRVLENGNSEVGVHIADVGHFVRTGSPLDLEASKRCTTVYLCGRRIDMLPEVLSSNLCSLRGGELRYAFSVIWEMDENAEIVGEPQFTKSLIKSRQAYTYQEAQDVVDNKKDESVLAKSLRGLMKLSKIMRDRRRQRGSLTLASMEIRFDFDEEGKTIGVQEKKNLDTMSMIEEFMLQANVSVAERILREYPNEAMLRRHPQPIPESFVPLIEAGKVQGFDIDTSTNQALAQSLEKAVDPTNPDVNRMLRMMATRCMSQAIYFPAGANRDHQHYGLAIPTYTHFTSPIRRYADIIVHRQLATYLNIFDRRDIPKMFKRFHLESVSDEMNRRNRLAQRANRASALLHAQFLLENQPKEADGFVTMVRDNGVTIVVKEYGVESIVEYPPENTTKLRLFQKVRVRLAVTERNQRRFLDMEILEPRLGNATGEALPEEGTVESFD
ncbi:Ribonuclease B and Ribonuclease II R domain containing protein [Aphelenchoides besseyi]|nr:Ribonuclease B and Ribonuclease II R domain containing protein [Aphelenchoides besseyi]